MFRLKYKRSSSGKIKIPTKSYKANDINGLFIFVNVVENSTSVYLHHNWMSVLKMSKYHKAGGAEMKKHAT